MSAQAIRLLIVDDHPAFRAGLVALLADEGDLQVVDECGDGQTAVELYRRHRPDVALMDLRLPGLSGVEAILAIRQEFPDARVIVLTTFDADEDIYRAIQSGAKSYLLKDMSKVEIVGAIRAVHAGQDALPEEVVPATGQDVTPGMLLLMLAACMGAAAAAVDMGRRRKARDDAE